MKRRHGVRAEDRRRREDMTRQELVKAIQAVDNGQATPRDLRLYQRAVASGLPLPGNSRYDYASPSITRLPDSSQSNRNWAATEFRRNTTLGIGVVVVPVPRTDAYIEDRATDRTKELDEPIAEESNDTSVQLKRPDWSNTSEVNLFKGTIFLTDGKSGESFVHIDPWNNADIAAGEGVFRISRRENAAGAGENHKEALDQPIRTELLSEEGLRPEVAVQMADAVLPLIDGLTPETKVPVNGNGIVGTFEGIPVGRSGWNLSNLPDFHRPFRGGQIFGGETQTRLFGAVGVEVVVLSVVENSGPLVEIRASSQKERL